MLKMIDLSTRFMQVEWLRNKTPQEVIAAIDDRWISYFGTMKQLLVDPGSENSSKEFQEFCEARGIQLLMTAVQAPHSNGICERHGAIVKDTLTRLIAAHPKESRHVLLSKAVMAHNCLANVHGHSPCQRTFGVNPRIGTLTDATPTMVNDFDESDDHIRRLRAMEAARRAFIQAETSRAIKKALKTQHQPTSSGHNLQIGDDVLFFDKRGPSAKGLWKGPGTCEEVADGRRHNTAAGRKTPNTSNTSSRVGLGRRTTTGGGCPDP